MQTRHRNDGLRKLCKCRRSSWPKCRHPWHFSFQWKGERRRLSLDRYVGHALRSKGDAERAADTVRTAIRDGVFSAVARPVQPQTADALAFDAYADIFLERYSKARQKASWQTDRSMLKWITAFALPGGGRLGEKPIGAVTEDDIETCLHDLRSRGRAASTRNHYLQTFKALSNWGLKKGYLARPWIGPLTDLKREKHAKRGRRLQPDEEPGLHRSRRPGCIA